MLLLLLFRVGVVLKHWIEKQFDDFDRKSLNILMDFINNTLMKDQETLARTLQKELSKKVT